MNHEIETMLRAAEGRYPTRAEQALIREWASRLEARLGALEELRTREEAIVRQTMADVVKAYPEFDAKMRGGREAAIRDLSLVLRYCGQAMLRGDPRYLEETLLAWFATILRGLGFAREFIADTYKLLGKHAKAELSPQAGELLRPFLDLCTERLAGAAEPEKVA